MVCGLALLTSCTEQELSAPNDVVICLGVSNALNTRAALNNLTDLSEEGSKVGVYGVKTTAESAGTLLSTLWNTGMLMQNVQTTAIATTGAISWANLYKYPATEETAKYVKFCLYYPYAAESATPLSVDYVTPATSGGAPVLHFTTTGGKDVMYTTPVTGARLTPASEVNFNHALTQLRFELIDDDGLFAFPITKVVLKDVLTKAEMNLETGALSNWGTPSTLALTLPSSPLTLGAGVKHTLSDVLMLQPGVASYDLEVTYTDGTSKTKSARVTPTGDNTFVAGKSYLITVNFKGSRPIELTATLTPWQAGGVGEAVIE